MSDLCKAILTQIETLLPQDEEGNFVAFSQSIPVKVALEKGYLTSEQSESWALGPDDPSGYDAEGHPLERSDVVHDFLSFLAEQMIAMNKEKREAIGKFWTDLEGVAAEGQLPKLRKGKQEKTLHKRCEACRPFVDETSGSSKHLDASLAWGEEAFKQFAKLLGGRVGNLSDLVWAYRGRDHDRGGQEPKCGR